MKFFQNFKSMLALGVLVCMAATASAQNDLDVKNASLCDVPVRYKHDDGTGGCPVTYHGGLAPTMTFTTIPSGIGSGQPFHVVVYDPSTGNSVSVGDCSLTSCGCTLPSSATLNICGVNYTVDFYPPGVMTPNAFVYIH